MPTTYVQHTLQANNRADVRNELVSLFLQEQPGTGTGANASRYRYTVETFNNYSIVLNRPAGLNKGFDFTVNIDGLKFKKQIERMQQIMKDNKDSLYTVDKAIEDIKVAFDELESVEEKYDYNKLPKGN